jgi:hypothetical protein
MSVLSTAPAMTSLPSRWYLGCTVEVTLGCPFLFNVRCSDYGDSKQPRDHIHRFFLTS